MPGLSFVLPVALRERALDWRNVDDHCSATRLRLLLLSLAKHLRRAEIDDFWIVSPARQAKAVAALVRGSLDDPRVAVVAEEEFCPPLAQRKHHERAGWYKQQIVKLAASTHCRSDFYLTLDLDVVALMPISRETLLPDGRALLNVERPSDYIDLYRPHFARSEMRTKRYRWTRAQEILGETRRPDRTQTFYGETPVLLHAEIGSSLIGRLTDAPSSVGDGASWVDRLLEQEGWTEYTLYFLHAESTGRLDEFYASCSRRRLLDLDASIWQPSEWYREHRDYSEWPPRETGLFGTVQSWLATDTWLPPEARDLEDFYRRVEHRLSMAEQ